MTIAQQLSPDAATHCVRYAVLAVQGSRGEGVAVKQAQHTSSAVSVVSLQVLPGPSRPVDQFNSVPSSPQAPPSLAPSEAGSYESEPAAGASVAICVATLLPQ